MNAIVDWLLLALKIFLVFRFRHGRRLANSRTPTLGDVCGRLATRWCLGHQATLVGDLTTGFLLAPVCQHRLPIGELVKVAAGSLRANVLISALIPTTGPVEKGENA